MELVICEKPKQAKEFSTVFSKFFNKPFTYTNGYYTNGDMIISNAIGHLVELADPKNYNPEFAQWKKEVLPIIPNPFLLQVSKNKNKQFNLLKSLINKADVIYNATDPEREGELIFRYILDLVNSKKAISYKRIWANNYQYKTLVDAYTNAEPLSNYDNLYNAAKARSQADWLIGINATRMLTVSSQTNKMLSLGRVQTAVLRLIVDRYNLHKNFKKEATYTPYINVNGINISLNKHFLVESEAKDILLKTPEKMNLSKEVSEVTLKQPKLFSLPDLQIQASSLFGISASKTLELAQALYENQLISYPRTDSNYLTEAQKNEVSEILKSNIQNPIQIGEKILDKNDLLTEGEFQNHFIFNDAKTSDHYAIIPLITSSSKISSLDKDQKIIYHLILSRFYQTFMKAAIIEKTAYFFKIDDDNFYSIKGQTIVKEGFLKFSKSKETILPKWDEGLFLISLKDISKGSTQPVKLFTEATLIKAMKNPLAYEKIEENKSSIKSLGTPATNDKFLPLLISRNYVNFEKKNIVPTNLGIAIIHTLRKTKLTSIALTADIEFQIEKIKTGELKYSLFMKAITRYCKILMTEIEEASQTIKASVPDETKARINCPKCEKGFLYLSKSKKNYYCSRYKEEDQCDFILYTNIAGKKLTEKNVLDLIKTKKTPVLNFTNKEKKKYKASIILDKEYKTQLIF